MKAFIVNSNYKIENEEPFIYLFGRLINNESFIAKVTYKPYFYIKEDDLTKALELFKVEYEKTNLKDFNENSVVKIFAKKPTDISELRKLYENNSIVSYESDIKFIQRYLIDKDIMAYVEIKGDYTKGEFVDRFYEFPEITSSSNQNINLKTIAFDIETDKFVKNIYSISLYSDGISEVHIITDKKLKNCVSYKNEKELLIGFNKRIKELDPDIILGWNVIDFDLNVLNKRMKELEIPFNISRTKKETNLKIFNNFLRDSYVDIEGRVVFDGISLLKQAFISFQDFKLDTVALKVLGENKLELQDDFWDNFTTIIKENPKLVADYNLKDSKLTYDIVKKKKLIELVIKKSLITGMHIDKVKGSVASLDSLYIRRAKKRNYVCPNSLYADREERIKGAFVMDPKPGIYDYVGVLDFKSLYPSVIRTFNIDPLSHNEKGNIVAPNNTRFINQEGILPQIIEELWKERDIAKKEKDIVKSNAIKIIMNSFYGVLANPNCRFYNLDMANAITAFARKIIKTTAKLITEKNYNVLYGDTDSVFVELKANNLEDAEKKGIKISNDINNYFKVEIKKKYNRDSVLELESEKIFKVLLLPKIRGSEGGAKKRYAGLLVKDNKEEIKITGMEFVRKDWTEISKIFQMELLNRVFHKKEISGYVKKMVDDIKSGKYDDLLVYRKSITKNLDEYTKTTPPHVKAARKLPKLKSNIIKYYITINGPEPVELKKSNIDYDHYIEKQIKPIAETILNLYDLNFDDILNGNNQKSLFDY
ncbi:MAG: DNA polymerase II [Candidatus Woesearchaeota archaeon]